METDGEENFSNNLFILAFSCFSLPSAVSDIDIIVFLTYIILVYQLHQLGGSWLGGDAWPVQQELPSATCIAAMSFAAEMMLPVWAAALCRLSPVFSLSPRRMFVKPRQANTTISHSTAH